MLYRVALCLALIAAPVAAVCQPGSPERIFADDFEDGSDRCWTGPLICPLDTGEQAPFCADSEPFAWWLDRCEEGWPCYRECELESTPQACLLLQIDYL